MQHLHVSSNLMNKMNEVVEVDFDMEREYYFCYIPRDGRSEAYTVWSFFNSNPGHNFPTVHDFMFNELKSCLSDESLSYSYRVWLWLNGGEQCFTDTYLKTKKS